MSAKEMITEMVDRIVHETDDAILVEFNGAEIWLPKSQIDYTGEVGDTLVDITMPEWLAEAKGFI